MYRYYREKLQFNHFWKLTGLKEPMHPCTSHKEWGRQLLVLWSGLVVVYTGPHLNQLQAEPGQPV